MDAVQYILSQKGSTIHSIASSATVLEATQMMNQHKIGSLVVRENDVPAGIFTERDVLRRVVAAERSPATTHVADVMTRDIVCCGPETDIDDAAAIMRDRRIRHLPVCDEQGKLMGIISIGDINAYYASSQQQHIRHLHDYVFGRV